MSKKFDTNPLDPEFPERAKQKQAAATARQKYDAETNKLPTTAAEEEIPTRSFKDADFNAYSSAFKDSQPIAPYKTARLKSETANNRKVAKVGLPENVLVALPYIPFYFGLIAGVLELIFVPKSETKVRFHAAQGLAAHIGILLVTSVLGLIGNLPGLGLADTGNWIFQLVTTIMLIIFAVKAWQGKPVHIESVDSLTEWLEEKIKPQN